MRLATVKLVNFRGYRNSGKVPIEQGATGIVGRNDYGKSTILEALAIFFDADGAKPDRNDMNFFSSEEGANTFEIACEFEDLPPSLILDDNVETTLQQEFLLNDRGTLEVVKVFRATTGKLAKTAIRCEHPVDDMLCKLLSLKMADLKALGEQHGIAESVADKRVSSLWRQAIRNASAPLTLGETLVDVEKDFSSEGKSIWGKIEAQLPTFALFKADRESSDGDDEAKNPLQQAVKEAKDAMQDQISKLEAEIESSVLEVANRTLEKLQEISPDLAKELKPRFKDKPKWIFNFSLDGENGIPINKRGSGVRRLILLNFFRAEAEKFVQGSNRNVIYAIEEPETSQHPNYQVMLMKALLTLSNQPNRQIILTTHVPALAGLIPTEGIRFITRDDEGSPQVKMPNAEVLTEAAESLGVLPETGIERANAVVLVEGKSDVLFLRHTAKVLKDAGYLTLDFEDVNIVPLLIGGCGSVKHWVTLNLAEDLGVPWCVFLDSDIGGDPSQVRANEKRRNEVEGRGRRFYSTRKREIENYLCPHLIEEQTGVSVEYSETCDAKKIIGAAVGAKPDDVIDRYWPLMTAEKIMEQSRYIHDDEERYELQEIIEDMLGMVV